MNKITTIYIEQDCTQGWCSTTFNVKLQLSLTPHCYIYWAIYNWTFLMESPVMNSCPSKKCTHTALWESGSCRTHPNQSHPPTQWVTQVMPTELYLIQHLSLSISPHRNSWCKGNKCTSTLSIAPLQPNLTPHPWPVGRLDQGAQQPTNSTDCSFVESEESTRAWGNPGGNVRVVVMWAVVDLLMPIPVRKKKFMPGWDCVVLLVGSYQ